MEEISDSPEKSICLVAQMDIPGGKMKINESQDLALGSIITISNKEGERFEINSLLPEGCSIYFDYTGAVSPYSHFDSKDNKIYLFDGDLKNDGAYFILTILHEIGHSVYFAQNQEEIEMMLSLDKDHFLAEADLLSLSAARSKDEKQAWLFAVRKLIQILDKLKIPPENILGSQDEMLTFIKKKLKTHQDSILSKAETSGLSGEEEIFETIKSLFQLDPDLV